MKVKPLHTKDEITTITTKLFDELQTYATNSNQKIDTAPKDIRKIFEKHIEKWKEEKNLEILKHIKKLIKADCKKDKANKNSQVSELRQIMLDEVKKQVGHQYYSRQK